MPPQLPSKRPADIQHIRKNSQLRPSAHNVSSPFHSGLFCWRGSAQNRANCSFFSFLSYDIFPLFVSPKRIIKMKQRKVLVTRWFLRFIPDISDTCKARSDYSKPSFRILSQEKRAENIEQFARALKISAIVWKSDRKKFYSTGRR